jgi:hypothetical protein
MNCDVRTPSPSQLARELTADPVRLTEKPMVNARPGD